ncbi:MAG: hypothetical protein IPH20_20325 [Bacteroidales bacterium]|nr:hypothetical protein [Bacteroidales bacterium]
MVVSATKPLWAIAADVTNEHATKVNFDQPYTVTGPFYAGVFLPSSTGDTLAIWCRKHVTGYNGTAWEQWSTNAWYPFCSSSPMAKGKAQFSQNADPQVNPRVSGTPAFSRFICHPRVGI